MLTETSLALVSLEQAVAAPFATRQLPDLGAGMRTGAVPSLDEHSATIPDELASVEDYRPWT